MNIQGEDIGGSANPKTQDWNVQGDQDGWTRSRHGEANRKQGLRASHGATEQKPHRHMRLQLPCPFSAPLKLFRKITF